MRTNKKRLDVLNFIQKVFFITLGSFLMALGLESFLIPNKIIDGGIVGISIMLSQILGIKLGIFLVILNLPFFYIGLKKIGKTFAFSTLYGISALSIFTFVLHGSEPATSETLLAAVFGGMILGIGVGIVIRSGGSLDGTEILAILMESKIPFSVGQIVMFFNFFILGSAGFVFGWDNAMFSLITYFIAFKLIDVVVDGLDESKSVIIISDKYEEISKVLMESLGKGVTFLNGYGAYSGEERRVVFSVINRLQEAKVKGLISEIDKNAFVAIGHVNEFSPNNSKH